MTRERSDSKAKPKRRGKAASSSARGSRPASQRSRPAATRARAGKSTDGSTVQSRSETTGSSRKRAATKAAPAARPLSPPEPKTRKAAPAAPAARKAAPAPAATAPAATARATRTTSRRQPARVSDAAPDTAADKTAARPARSVKAKGARTAPATARTVKAAAVKVAPAAPAPPARSRKAVRQTVTPPEPNRKGEVDLSDEERVELAKYVTGGEPPRVFEEERFIFPETYGRNRVRLLVKDPFWLFAHWDVDPGIFSGLRGELGERAAALSRLTLKVTDPEHGGGAVIHLPEDARSWYVRADRVRRPYRAELGLTLPSGEYRLLATSNIVRPPQGTASHRRATRRAVYVGPRRPPSAPADWSEHGADLVDAERPGGEPGRPGDARRRHPGPWEPSLVEPLTAGGRRGSAAGEDGEAGEPGAAGDKGGASDVHRPRPSGASDLYRR